ncbi:hypothetical protein ABE236_12245 [Priestia endophytica]|uniref:hypothetical protein n=1 Tax=Priestia endophytica TaxID=135735 RepID=UPI003D289B35
MKRTVGIFLIVQSLLTYLIIDALNNPIKVREEIIDVNTGVTTVSYNLPFINSISYGIPIISFILGIYLILTKGKQREVKIQRLCD